MAVLPKVLIFSRYFRGGKLCFEVQVVTGTYVDISTS